MASYPKLKEIVNDIQKGEGQEREFKLDISDSIGKAFAAFSTSNDGKVYLGVHSDKTIKGFRSSENKLKQISTMASNCQPPTHIKITEVPFEGEWTIVAIDVSESPIKPTKWKGRSYKRVGKECIECSDQETLTLSIESQGIQFDLLVAKNDEREALVQDIDEPKITDFVNLAKKRRNKEFNFTSIEQFLMNTKLFNKTTNELTNAAVLLFGKDSQKFIANSQINLSVFPGEDVIEDGFIRQFLRGDLIKLIDNSIQTIMKFAPPRSYIRGTQRIDITPYPYMALRELITNAVVHRDYFIQGEVTIRIFSDRIEISNPGGLMRGIDREALTKGKNALSVRRNKLLAEMLDAAGFMERSGHGIIRVLKQIREHGLEPPNFEISEDSFKVIVFSNKEKIRVKTKKSLDDLSKGQMKVLKIILRKKKPIGNQELINKAKVTRGYLNMLTNDLLEKGHISKKKDGREVYFYATQKTAPNGTS